MSSGLTWYTSTGSAPSAVLPTTPITSVFTTEYYFTAWAADSTSDWSATYTIQEVCTGDQATWTTPAIPPDFITTIVTCDVCQLPTQLITCPIDTADRTGSASIWGNGVTATPTAAGGQSASNTALDVWWAGALLTQSASASGNSKMSSQTGYVTADAATIWGNLALLSGALTLAVGWILWQ